MINLVDRMRKRYYNSVMKPTDAPGMTDGRDRFDSGPSFNLAFAVVPALLVGSTPTMQRRVWEVATKTTAVKVSYK